MSELLKSCTRCQREKPVEAFSHRSRLDQRLVSRCKQCVAEFNMHRYQGTHPKRRVTPLSAEQRREVAARGKLICVACGAEKSLSEFGVSRTDGRTYARRRCKGCELERLQRWRESHPQNRWSQAIRYKCPRYGITPQQYMAMLRAQGDCCAICRRPLPLKGQTVDHDHATGAVRGIVHPQCNLLIGNAGENIEVLERAIEYLKLYRMRRTLEAQAA